MPHAHRKRVTRKLLSAAVGAGVAAAPMPALAQQPQDPQMVLERTYSLHLVTDMNPDRCTVVGRTVWRPETPPTVRLQVGDTVTVTPVVHRPSADVVRWSGTWNWETTRRCGFLGWSTCRDSHEHKREGNSSFALSNTLTVNVLFDHEQLPVTSGRQIRPIERVFVQSATLAVDAAFAAFRAPDNPPPHPSARLTRPLCAEIAIRDVQVLDLSVRILRRPR